METKLITNDQQLRRYLPNAFDTVEGETTFHEKILPWLDQAERWVFTQFIGDDFAPELLAMEETEPLRTCATLVVVHEAPGYCYRAVDPQPVPQQHMECQSQAAMV